MNWVNFDINKLNGHSNDLSLNGLDKFIKALEKYFFSRVFVRQFTSSNAKEVNLTIEVICPMKFSQNVEHFRMVTISDTGYNSRRLLNILSELQEVNNVLIDIEELSLTMEDTSIIIQRIDSLSIARQLDNILRLVLSTANHIVSQIREIPEEIHIPVLAATEEKEEYKSILSEFNTNKTSDKDYFSFWGLCYESSFDTIIYDVENSSFIFEDVLFFPQ